jgi:hypothetical protein
MTLENLSFVLLWIGVVLMSVSLALLVYSQYAKCPLKTYRAVRFGQALMDFAIVAVGCAIFVNAIYHLN